MKSQQEQSFLVNVSVLTLRGKMFAKYIQCFDVVSPSVGRGWRVAAITCTPSVKTRVRGQKNFLAVGGNELIPTAKDPPWFAFSF